MTLSKEQAVSVENIHSTFHSWYICILDITYTICPTNTIDPYVSRHVDLQMSLYMAASINHKTSMVCTSSRIKIGPTDYNLSRISTTCENKQYVGLQWGPNCRGSPGDTSELCIHQGTTGRTFTVNYYQHSNHVYGSGIITSKDSVRLCLCYKVFV